MRKKRNRTLSGPIGNSSDMGSVKEGRNVGRVRFSHNAATTLVLTAIILSALSLSQGGVEAAEDADLQLSETCYGTGNCSLHSLGCRGGGSKLGILEAAYGFQLAAVAQGCAQAGSGDTCVEGCCSHNATTDCKQGYTADNLERVQRECSHAASCHTRAQWSSNLDCSPSTRAATSTLSIIRALCVPDATTVHPCSNSTVSGHTVSLDVSSPPLSSPCQCTVHQTSTNTTNAITSSNSSVQLYVYEIVSSSANWDVRVDNSEGVAPWQFADVGTVFPAAILTSPEFSSLPLSVTFSFQNLTDSPQRLWLGFRDEQSSLTLRCGQDAIDYAMSLTTTSTPEPTTTTTPTLPTTTTATPTTPATITTTDVPEQTASEETTSEGEDDSQSSTTEDSKKASNETLSGDSSGADSTDIIIYAVVGIAALLVGAFIFVFIRQLRKRHLCGDLHRAQSQSYSFTTTTTITTSSTSTSTILIPSTITSSSSSSNYYSSSSAAEAVPPGAPQPAAPCTAETTELHTDTKAPPPPSPPPASPTPQQQVPDSPKDTGAEKSSSSSPTEAEGSRPLEMATLSTH